MVINMQAFQQTKQSTNEIKSNVTPKNITNSMAWNTSLAEYSACLTARGRKLDSWHVNKICY